MSGILDMKSVPMPLKRREEPVELVNPLAGVAVGTVVPVMESMPVAVPPKEPAAPDVPAPVARGTREGSVPGRVRAWLAEQGRAVLTKEINGAFPEVSRESVNFALWWLEKRGEAIHHAYGWWGAPGTEPPTEAQIAAGNKRYARRKKPVREVVRAPVVSVGQLGAAASQSLHPLPASPSEGEESKSVVNVGQLGGRKRGGMWPTRTRDVLRQLKVPARAGPAPWGPEAAKLIMAARAGEFGDIGKALADSLSANDAAVMMNTNAKRHTLGVLAALGELPKIEEVVMEGGGMKLADWMVTASGEAEEDFGVELGTKMEAILSDPVTAGVTLGAVQAWVVTLAIKMDLTVDGMFELMDYGMEGGENARFAMEWFLRGLQARPRAELPKNN